MDWDLRDHTNIPKEEEEERQKCSGRRYPSEREVNCPFTTNEFKGVGRFFFFLYNLQLFLLFLISTISIHIISFLYETLSSFILIPKNNKSSFLYFNLFRSTEQVIRKLLVDTTVLTTKLESQLALYDSFIISILTTAYCSFHPFLP